MFHFVSALSRMRTSDRCSHLYAILLQSPNQYHPNARLELAYRKPGNVVSRRDYGPHFLRSLCLKSHQNGHSTARFPAHFAPISCYETSVEICQASLSAYRLRSARDRRDTVADSCLSSHVRNAPVVKKVSRVFFATMRFGEERFIFIPCIQPSRTVERREMNSRFHRPNSPMQQPSWVCCSDRRPSPPSHKSLHPLHTRNMTLVRQI